MANTLGARLQLGPVELGLRPRIVLAVRGPSASVRRAVERGVDVLELRVDQLPQPSVPSAVAAAQALARLGKPLLATVRRAREGGAVALPDSRRRELFLALLPLVDAVDIELASLEALRPVVETARARGKLVLLSYHNFQSTPSLSQLRERVRRARRAGAHIVKLATQIRRREDLLRLFTLTWSERHRGVVTMGMGRAGTLSRLLLPAAGSLLVYTSLSPVFGQIPLQRLVSDLEFYFPPPDADGAAGATSRGRDFS